MRRFLILPLVVACAETPATDPGPLTWREDDARRLPTPWLDRPCMDVELADVDADADLDVVVAVEGPANVLLLNDGTGRFTAVDVPWREPTDSEHAQVGDLDGDGHLDLFFANEDLGGEDELYLGDGIGGFVDASDTLPGPATSNAAVIADFDGDGLNDLLRGNAGANTLWVGQGNRLAAVKGLPESLLTTQDVAVGDLDDDGDLDVVFGNEGADTVWRNEGDARFVEVPDAIPNPDGETREVGLGDADGDGILDLVVAHVSWTGGDPQSDLWLGNGDATFRRSPRRSLPRDRLDSLDLDFVDLDGDGDLDLLGAHTTFDAAGLGPGPWTAWANDDGRFTDATAEWFVDRPHGNAIDIEAADLDGDDVLDVYLCARTGPDRVLFGGYGG